MPTSPETSLNNDLVTAVAGAASGDPTQIRTLFDRARKRVEQRAVEELRRRLDGDTGAAPAGTGAAPAGTDADAAPRPAPRMAPLRSARIRLPSGKQVRVAMTPAPARASDLAALSQVTADNDRRAFRVLCRHGKALDELTRAQADLADRVSDLEQRSDFVLVGLLRGFRDLEQRMKTLTTQLGSTGAAVKQQAKQLGSQAASAQLQKVLDAVSSAQVAAFGEKGSVFSTNNLLLAGNQLLWGFIEPLLRYLGIDFGMSPSPLAYLAPLGSLSLGALTVGRSQHVRFLSGTATVPDQPGVTRIDLLPMIAPADRDAFARRTDVLVTLKTLDANFEAAVATVENGTLIISLEDGFGRSFRVAWLVDTGLGG